MRKKYLENRETGLVVIAREFKPGEMSDEKWKEPSLAKKKAAIKRMVKSEVEQECTDRIARNYSIEDQLSDIRRVLNIRARQEASRFENNIEYVLHPEEEIVMTRYEIESAYIEGVIDSKNNIIDLFDVKSQNELEDLDYKDNLLWPSRGVESPDVI